MKIFIRHFVIILCLLFAPAIPIIAHTAEVLCPTFKPQVVQRWNTNKNAWEKREEVNGFLVLHILTSYVSLVGVIITTSFATE